MCPKRPEIGDRTQCRSYAQTLSDSPLRVSENRQSDSPGHIVQLSLDMCPKRPEIGDRTQCRSYAQRVSETSGNRRSDTVSELCSRRVRFSLKGCPKIGRRTPSDTSLGLMLKTCPNCPESLQKCNFLPAAQRRTLLSDSTSTCVRNVRFRSSDTVSDIASRPVRFSLKGCPEIQEPQY